MTTWQEMLRVACERGGGPLQSGQIDAGLPFCGRVAMRELYRRKLVERADYRRFIVTQAGWDVYNGIAVQKPVAGKRWQWRPVIGATVPDPLIERVLLASGFEPGEQITLDVLRRYSAGLVAMTRISVRPGAV